MYSLLAEASDSGRFNLWAVDLQALWICYNGLCSVYKLSFWHRLSLTPWMLMLWCNKKSKPSLNPVALCHSSPAHLILMKSDTDYKPPSNRKHQPFQLNFLTHVVKLHLPSRHAVNIWCNVLRLPNKTNSIIVRSDAEAPRLFRRRSVSGWLGKRLPQLSKTFRVI